MKKIIALTLLIAYMLGSQFFVKSGQIFLVVDSLLHDEMHEQLSDDEFECKYNCWKKHSVNAYASLVSPLFLDDFSIIYASSTSFSTIFSSVSDDIVFLSGAPPDPYIFDPRLVQKKSVILLV